MQVQLPPPSPKSIQVGCSSGPVSPTHGGLCESAEWERASVSGARLRFYFFFFFPMHCTLGGSGNTAAVMGYTLKTMMCAKRACRHRVSTRGCVRQLQLQRRAHEIHGEQKEEADWIMGGKEKERTVKGGREKIRDRERRGGERERYCGPT